MVGVKRSSRLVAARQSRPKHSDSESEEEEHSTQSQESDENEESDFSDGGGSDQALNLKNMSLPTAETRVVTRKGRMDKQPQLSAVTSTKTSSRKSLKAKAKKKSKVKPTSLKSDLNQKTHNSPSKSDDGSDHAEEDVDPVYARWTETSQRESKPVNLKIPPPEDEISKSRFFMLQEKYESTTKPMKNVGDFVAADSDEYDGELPPTFKKSGADEGSRQVEARNDGRDKATQENLDTETATDSTHENAPAAVERNYSNPYLNDVNGPSSPITPREMQTGTGSPQSSEREAKPKYLKVSDTAKSSEGIINKSMWPITDDVEGGQLPDTVDPLMQINGQGKDHEKGKSGLIISSLLNEASAACLEPLSSVNLAVSFVEAKTDIAEIISKSTVHKSNRAVDKAEPDQSRSGQSMTSPMEIEQNDKLLNSAGDAMMEFAKSRIPNGLTAGHGDTMSKFLPVDSQAWKEMQGSSMSSLNKQVGSLPDSYQMDVSETFSTSIQYPKLKRTRRPPSIGELKMVLFLEISNVHRGNGAERMFAYYLETLEKYVTLGPHGATKRTKSSLSPILTGTETSFGGELKTRRIKRLHNKLVLAIMREAMKTTVPEDCFLHVPQQWQAAVFRSKEEDLSVYDIYCDQKSALIQWNNTFDPCSGAWTVCGDGSAQTKVDAESGHAIRSDLSGKICKEDLKEEEVLPSARLPGALEIEPLVRKHTEKLGFTSSNNAIWMLVVAVREHSLSLIKKVIENDKDFRDGYAPSLPTSRISLSCNNLTPQDCNRRNERKSLQTSHSTENSGKPVKHGKKVINSTNLSHALAETLAVASRLTSNRSLIISDGRGISSDCPGLDNKNCIINASIQREARKMQRSYTSNPNVLNEVTMSTLLDVRPNKQSAKTRPSTKQSLPTILLPLHTPQSTARTSNFSTSTLSPPQYQSSLLSTPSQNIQLPNYDHSVQIKALRQQTFSHSRAEVLDLEPLTKPGVSNVTNDSQKPNPYKNSAPSIESSPPRATKRSAKNLAAMMASPPSQSNIVSNKGSTASDGKNCNRATLDKTTGTKQKEQTETQKGCTSDEKHDTDESSSTVVGPSRPKGRGFGVKNLSKMRSRASDSVN